MPKLIKDRAIADDRWTLVRGVDETLPAGPVIVPLATWKAQRESLIARGDVGVWLAPNEDPSEIAGDLAHFGVVAVDFPQFTDGRGYSTGRLLRERYRYAGELRSIGDVLLDQLYYMSQCGFNAFSLREDRSAEEALTGLSVFTDGYQLTNARTPWFRRRSRSQARFGVAHSIE